MTALLIECTINHVLVGSVTACNFSSLSESLTGNVRVSVDPLSLPLDVVGLHPLAQVRASCPTLKGKPLVHTFPSTRYT